MFLGKGEPKGSPFFMLIYILGARWVKCFEAHKHTNKASSRSFWLLKVTKFLCSDGHRKHYLLKGYKDTETCRIDTE